MMKKIIHQEFLVDFRFRVSGSEPEIQNPKFRASCVGAAPRQLSCPSGASGAVVIKNRPLSADGFQKKKGIHLRPRGGGLVDAAGFRVQGAGCRVQGSGSRPADHNPPCPCAEPEPNSRSCICSGKAHRPLCKNNYSTDICSGSEAGSYLRRIDFCITQL